MIADSIALAASENLRYTYFELGRSARNSQVWQEAGFTACVGDFDHPICNFAAGLDIGPHAAHRLARIAVERGAFNVYRAPGDRPDNLPLIMREAGFCRTYALAQMVAEGRGEEPKGALSRARTYYDRFQIALFMVDQFFNKQGQQFRRQVAESTARANSLELLALRRDGQILGAAMVGFTNGMAGVYNLCVDVSLRGLGMGSSIVREILAVCAVKNATATLQCDPKLESWYAELGFRRCGEIEVFVLPRPGGLL